MGAHHTAALVSARSHRFRLVQARSAIGGHSAADAGLASQQGVVPAGVIGYMTKKAVVGVFPQYYFGIGARDDRRSGVSDASDLNLLYFAVFNLPDAWQVGLNPTIS